MKIDNQAPVIGIPVCVKTIEDLPFHSVGDKYVRAVSEAAQAMPFLIPALGNDYDFDHLVERLDGLLLTGSLSNVAAHLYQGPQDRPDSPQDPHRDATTLPLIRAALKADLPLFCICRGLQELNVSLGGSLHQQVHLLRGKQDHRSVQGVPYDEKYSPRHEVRFADDGVFARITGDQVVQVNSLHWQAIDRLAPGLIAEGTTPDGLIEAVRVAQASFALGVQWHPEYRATENPVSTKLFAAFGAAARTRALSRQTRTRPAHASAA